MKNEGWSKTMEIAEAAGEVQSERDVICQSAVKGANHAARNVCDGWVEAARHAGINPASNEANASVKTDATTTLASTPFTSNNCDSMNLAQRSVAGIPMPNPIAVWLMA